MSVRRFRVFRNRVVRSLLPISRTVLCRTQFVDRILLSVCVCVCVGRCKAVPGGGMRGGVGWFRVRTQIRRDKIRFYLAG